MINMKHLIFLLFLLLSSCANNPRQQHDVIVIDKAFSAGGSNWAPGMSMSGKVGWHVVTTHDKYVLFYKFNNRICQEEVSCDEYVNTQIGDTITIEQ